MRMNIRTALSHIMLATLSLSPVSAYAGKTALDTNGETVVVQLYRDFGWEALADSSGPGASLFGVPLAEQPLEKLEKYFEKPLAEQLVNDSTCVAKNHGDECNLSFNIIFASQDPSASDLTIEASAVNKVKVSFTYPSNGEKVSIEYLTEKTPAGWRIKDVIYLNQANESLSHILSQKQ